jgi:hypothetical protein
MEVQDYFENGIGDTLTKVESNEKSALYQVIGKDCIAKDIYFAIALEPKTDSFGTKKLHMVGAQDWEKTGGKYFKGLPAAKAYLEKLNPDKHDDYYNNQIK